MNLLWRGADMKRRPRFSRYGMEGRHHGLGMNIAG